VSELVNGPLSTRRRECDVCGKELVPIMGTWICPDSAAQLRVNES
jgi:hypothetical protein